MSSKVPAEGAGLIGRVSDAAVLSGAIMFLMGLYYFSVKGGIPYQDPTPEMQARYAVIIGTGSILMKNGLLTGLLGLVLRVCLKIPFWGHKDTGHEEEL